MGWLTKLADRRSADQIAAAMNVGGGNPRSLGNRVRALDAGKSGWWLEDKNRKKLRALAALLQISESELRQQIIEHAVEPHPTWSLDVLGKVPPLDLARENPFPGVPPPLLQPDRWTRLLWYAPSGAGRTMVGRWLEARKLARHLRADHLEDVSAQLNVELPVFVELSAEASDQEVLRFRPPAGVKICVAVPFAGPTAKAPEKSSWKTVETPPPSEWIDALVEWIAARFDPSQKFDVEGILGYLQHGSASAAISTPGEALAFAGLIHHHGVETFEQTTIEELVRAHLSQIAARTDVAGEDLRTWLQKYGAAFLREVATRAIAGELDLVNVGLPEPAWRELIGETAIALGGIEEARRLIRDHDTPLERDRLEALLAPDPIKTVKALSALGLLTSIGARRFAIRPAWLANVIVQDALYASFDGELAPSTWRDLLPTHAAVLIELALQRAAGGDVEFAKEALADFEDQTSPKIAVVMGVEAAFIALGLAKLSGAELDPALLERAWRAQTATAIDRGWDQYPPIPRTLPLDRSNGPFVASYGAYFLAAWSISEHLDASLTKDAHVLWSPWSAKDPVALHRAAHHLDLFARHRREPPPKELVRPAYELAGRLFERFDWSKEAHLNDDLFLPAALVSGAQGTFAPDPNTIGQLSHRAPLLEAIEWEAARRKFPLDEVMLWLWRQWATLQWCPPITWLHAPGSSEPQEDGLRLWRSVPMQMLFNQNFVRALNRSEQRRAIWSAWRNSPPRWSAWIATTLRSLEDKTVNDHYGEVQRASLAWGTMPEELVIEHLHVLRTELGPEIVQELWRRVPEVLSVYFRERTAIDPNEVIEYLWRTPAEHQRELLELAEVCLAKRSALDQKHRRVLTGWLHHYVISRYEDWRRAYAMLGVLAPIEAAPSSDPLLN